MLFAFSVAGLCGCAVAAPSPVTPTSPKGVSLTVTARTAQPLDDVQVGVAGLAPNGSVLEARDGISRLYARVPLVANGVSVRVAGALGPHTFTAIDSAGHHLGAAVVVVDCQTGLQDEQGPAGNAAFTRLLGSLTNTMGRGSSTVLNGKPHHWFVPWIRDHTHVLKAMKYFDADLMSGVDLYRDTQRADGMIWDNHSKGSKINHWDARFADFDFVGRYDNNNLQFRRIPVEADVEYLYVEAVWHAWKATGDAAWLQKTLPSAERALRYSMSDPMRWSKTLQLVKRGYTIDTWDFQNDEDAKRSGDAMKIDPVKTRFGVMFGDNTGVYNSALLLADMLQSAGQDARAKAWRIDASALKQRLDDVAWNGQFYTHHVPEDASVKRDLGVNEKEQVSLSNAYSLNRGITLPQRQSIIKTYQKIRANLPPGSPGEWYTIYPIFNKGYGDHNEHWHYMNGGVVSIVAGELAHGALEAGFEDYGVDILTRVGGLASKYGGRLPVTLKGANPPKVEPHYTSLAIKNVANVALTAAGVKEHGRKNKPVVWTGDENNDLPDFPRGPQSFKNVPFTVLADGAAGARVALGLAKPAGRSPRGKKLGATGFVESAVISANGKANTVYLLHASSGAKDTVGNVELQYKDGSSAVVPVKVGSDVFGWWYPEPPSPGRGGNDEAPRAVIAWEGKNASAMRVGVTLCGLRNPHPDRDLTALKFEAAPNGSKWMVLGATLSDSEASFGDSTVSFGIPDNWGAAAVAYALIEGLAGVKDTSVKMQTVALSPRWAAAPSVRSVTSTVKYPASQGYVRYHFENTPQALRFDVTGSGSLANFSVYLPVGTKASAVLRKDALGEDEPVRFSQATLGSSRYARFSIPLNADGVGVEHIEVRLGR